MADVPESEAGVLGVPEGEQPRVDPYRDGPYGKGCGGYPDHMFCSHPGPQVGDLCGDFPGALPGCAKLLGHGGPCEVPEPSPLELVWRCENYHEFSLKPHPKFHSHYCRKCGLWLDPICDYPCAACSERGLFAPGDS